MRLYNLCIVFIWIVRFQKTQFGFMFCSSDQSQRNIFSLLCTSQKRKVCQYTQIISFGSIKQPITNVVFKIHVLIGFDTEAK